MRIEDCLPTQLGLLIKNLDKLQQIRIVADAPVKVRLDGINYYISSNGLQKSPLGCVSLSADEIAQFIQNACQGSIYAFEKQIANGYLTLDDGTRIGVSGIGSVSEGGSVYFRNYHSVCIRINKGVANCSSVVGDKILYSNILVVGLPGYGKTTLLRDLATRASSKFDIVLLDERGELSMVDGFEKRCFCDVMTYIEKGRSARLALRSLSPQIVVCDEIFDDDAEWLLVALNSGVKVFASLHADDVESAKRFCQSNGLKFDYFVILEQFGGKKAKLYDHLANYIVL